MSPGTDSTTDACQTGSLFYVFETKDDVLQKRVLFGCRTRDSSHMKWIYFYIIFSFLLFRIFFLLFFRTSKHSGRPSVTRLRNEHCPFRPRPVTLISGFLPFLEFFFLVALRPHAGHGLLIHKVSRSHTRRITVGRTPLDE